MNHCKDCQFWGQIKNANGKNCELQLRNEAGVKMWVSMYDIIFTAPDFGCVQFKPK